MRDKITRLLLSTLVLVLASLVPASAPLRAQSGAVVHRHPDGAHLAAPDGRLFFVLGYNYEGPYDRAWRMWERYDLNLIAADLGKARAGGANTLRIFIQEPLPAEIMAGNFDKLDAVLNLMTQQGLLALVTFYDYGEDDLQKVAEVSRRVAERYRGHPAILGYDLRNEPQFFTLATPTYPPGADVPLQRADLVGAYGERIGMGDIPGYRQSGEGRILPGHWSDEQVHAYANNLAFYREFLNASDRWVLSASGRSSIDFPRSAEGQSWQPLWAAFDQTLSAWIDAQAQAIRAADPDHMITIGWNNPLLASLPANGKLDFHSLHRFPAPTVGTANQTIDIAHKLRGLFPQHPLVFEEIGYTNHEIDENGSAALEMIVALRAYSEGFAGFLKWQLTDLPPVGSPREDNFGAIRTDGSGKPIYHTMAAFQTYLSSTAAQPGGLITTWTDGSSGPGYRFIHQDVLYVAAWGGSGDGIRVQLRAPGQVLLRKRGPIYLVSTQPGIIGLNLRTLMASWTGGAARVEQRSGSGWQAITARGGGDEVEFDVQPAVPYRISLPRHTDPATARSGCRFFPETRHNLCGGFRAYWEANGGLAIFGLPLSEEFTERNSSDGNFYTVQYFERNRFEYHPENKGTPYEVLLGLLGNDLTAGRRGEAPFQRIDTPPAGPDYFPETGHTLGGTFRDYWRANGGLAIFGYPISQEFEEYNPADGKIYTVQYFERNRFEYHPENAGTRYEVLLGLLGNQTVDGNGWR